MASSRNKTSIMYVMGSLDVGYVTRHRMRCRLFFFLVLYRENKYYKTCTAWKYSISLPTVSLTVYYQINTVKVLQFVWKNNLLWHCSWIFREESLSILDVSYIFNNNILVRLYKYNTIVETRSPNSTKRSYSSKIGQLHF